MARVRKPRLFKKENGLFGCKMAKLKLVIEIESLLIKEIVSICGGKPSGVNRLGAPRVKVLNSCGLETLAIVGNNQAVAEGQNSTALIILNKVRK